PPGALSARPVAPTVVVVVLATGGAVVGAMVDVVVDVVVDGELPAAAVVVVVVGQTGSRDDPPDGTRVHAARVVDVEGEIPSTPEAACPRPGKAATLSTRPVASARPTRPVARTSTAPVPRHWGAPACPDGPFWVEPFRVEPFRRSWSSSTAASPKVSASSARYSSVMTHEPPKGRVHRPDLSASGVRSSRIFQRTARPE